MEDQAILLRYHEIALKGDNRGWFEDRLAINAKKFLRRAMGKESPIEVRRPHGRIVLHTPWNEGAQEALSRVFGISSYSPMRKVKTDRKILIESCVEEFENYSTQHGQPRTFRVRSRRSDKVFPESSMEIDRQIGSVIKDKYPALIVDLKEADFTIGIEIRHRESFIWSEKNLGPGGLPVGTNARVLSLLSGGLDSPIASIYALRRGSPTSYVHFYGAPFVGEEVLEKIEDLVRLINRFHPDPQPLHVIPFGKIQEKIALVTNPKMRTLLYRRMMIRIATELAKRIGAEALITGESIGQVASQTVENMASINSVATIPILRPLITFDKDEIIAKAHEWGTFDTSVRPAVDCCTLFADRHPSLRASISLLEEQEARYSVADLVEEALAGLEIRRIRIPNALA